LTDTTQPHPEPSEEATFPPFPQNAIMSADAWRWSTERDSIWLHRVGVGQSQLNAMRVERDAAREHFAQVCEQYNAMAGEFSALKTAPVVDVEAIKRDARAEALRNFRHEHGQDFSDAKKWREWQEAQRLIEEEMPEGYAVTLVCSPGDWDLRFTDPECEDIRIDCYESTEDFIRTAVAHAKEHVRAAATMAQTKETP
jgi:hypothetical protein